jgi:hypothetical protein
MANNGQQFPNVSVYMYYDPRFNPIDQANKVVSVLAAYKGRIRRVYLDLEFTWGGSYEAPQYWKTCRDIIRNAGYKTGWYTRATWWDSRVGNYAAEFATDPVWAAQYNTNLTLIPKGWTKAMIWQKGTPAIGADAGVSSAEIDLDLWNTDFDFVAEWGGVQPPPPGGDMHIEGTVIVGAVKIRMEPGGAEYNPPRYLYNNDKIKASEVYDGRWLKLYEVNGVASVGWSSAGSNQDYIRWDWVQDPEPPPPPPPPPVGPPILHIRSDGNDTYPAFDFEVKPK